MKNQLSASSSANKFQAKIIPTSNKRNLSAGKSQINIKEEQKQLNQSLNKSLNTSQSQKRNTNPSQQNNDNLEESKLVVKDDAAPSQDLNSKSTPLSYKFSTDGPKVIKGILKKPKQEEHKKFSRNEEPFSFDPQKNKNKQNQTKIQDTSKQLQKSNDPFSFDPKKNDARQQSQQSFSQVENVFKQSQTITSNSKTSHSREPSDTTPLTIVSAYQNSLNQQHLATQTVDAAFEEYLKVQEELAARGEIEEAIKNLQDGLNERLNYYPARDRGVWLISKMLSEIGIRLAVRCLNQDKAEKAYQFLKLARKHTEPLPNSDWSENQEWMTTRKNVFKNLALFYQRKEDWGKAFDCFKVALKLERDLKENYANTSLTCAMILSKLNRYAESIEYAQYCMNQIELQMNIDKNKPLAEYKFFGIDQTKAAEYDKVMTSYAISLHLLGNNIANLKYIKEAKVFLSKASYVATSMLNKPKLELQLAITNDLNNLQKNYKTQLVANKKQIMEDIEQSLLTIKTNLANSSYSLLADQQEQKALVGTITNGPPLKLIKKEPPKTKKRMKELEDLEEDEDDDKKVMTFVQRFAEEKKKKETETLDEYHKRIQQDYDEKQREYVERQQKNKFTQEGKDEFKQKYDLSGQFNKADGTRAMAPSMQTIQQIQDKRRAAAQKNRVKSAAEAVTDDERSSRIKKSQINPAAEGAKLDRKGVKYSSDKGTKNFITKRKQNIERVNERHGFASGQIIDDDEEEQMTEWQGGATKQDDIKKFEDLKLPPIKGYKLDDLGLGAAGERALAKYEGYQSDHSQKSKNLFNNQDISTRKLLQTVENNYRRNLPSSVKQAQEDDGSDDLERDLDDKNIANPFKTISGELRSIPVYNPPQQQQIDWRKEGQHSSSDDELPDTKKVLDKLKNQGAIIEKAHERLFDEDTPALDLNQTDANRVQRVTIFNKPPIQKSSTTSIPKQINEQKSQLAGQIGKNLGMTPKGSPRGQSVDNAVQKQTQIGQTETPSQRTPNQSVQARGQRSKFGQNKTQPSQNKKEKTKQQYVPPGQRKRPQRADPWGGEDSDEKRQKRLASQQRLSELAQPKPKKYVLVKDDEDEKEEDEVEQKAKAINQKVEKGKAINFSEYVDRDVKYIKNNTHGVGSDNTAKQKGFDTKLNNKTGLFSKLGAKEKQIDEEQNNAEQKGDKTGKAGTVKYIKDKKAKTTKNGRKDNNSPIGANGVEDIVDDAPEFLRRNNLDGIQGGFAYFLKKQQRSLANPQQNNGQNQNKRKTTIKQGAASSYGLTIAGGNNLTLGELRLLEGAAATHVQKMVKGYFIRKWYLNYQIRKRLGIPFSGLEFTENAFLRFFTRPNQRLHDMALLPPQLVEVVNEQSKMRNLLNKTYKHQAKSKKKQKKKVLFVNEELEDDPENLADQSQANLSEEENLAQKKPSPVRRIPKGATPQQLLDNLQKDFVAKGLDAYTQFKKYGGGIEHNEKGEPKDKNTIIRDDKLGLEELNQQEQKIPKWIGDQINQDRFLNVQEQEEYLKKIGKIKGARKVLEEETALNQGVQLDANGKPIPKQVFSASLAAFAQIHGVFKKPEEKSYNEHQKNDNYDENESGDDDIQELLRKRRQIDEDEDFFPIEKYQEFSREVIVFYKRIGDMMIKWTILVGSAFKKDRKFYIPIKLLGEPLKSRNSILVYLMNLELLKISKDIDKNFEFETIWPFILYLFNNWVRHQIRMMGLIDQRPDLKNTFAHSENNMYDMQEFDGNLKQAKEEYNDMLNFSSEIEYDDRFDYEKYKRENNPDQLIDRQTQQELRLRPIEQLKVNKEKLFNSYKQKINMYEQLMQQIDTEKDVTAYNEQGKQVKRVKILTNDMYEPVYARKVNPFDFFLKMHFVPLPRSDQGQYKLIQNLQANSYSEKLKKQGLIEDNIAIMNEERRKRRGLPPMSLIDYNCIDRAAQKLKVIIECLFLKRGMNGWCLVPRDVKESLMAKEWQLRKQKNLQIACKQDKISSTLMQMFGMHIQYPKYFNERAIQIQQSVKKVENFRNEQKLEAMIEFDKQNSGIQLDDEMRQYKLNIQEDGDVNLNTIQNSSRGQNTLALRSHISQNQLPQVDEQVIQQQESIQEKEDALGKLMDLQKNKQEIEDFIKEQEILEQGVIKIETNYYIMTLIFRKIVSNYENMRIIIDERIKRFSGDVDSDEERIKELDRMRSRPCEFVSSHPQVLKYDADNHSDIKDMEKLDIEQEKLTKKKTQFKSYAEIKVCSKISTTNWDDSFNVNWETLEIFFGKFNYKWKPIEFLSRRRFNMKERFTFYNFFAECLFIFDCRVQIDLDKLDIRAYKFEKIYLNLDQIQQTKKQHKMTFYFDDYLESTFDDALYDYPIYPFYEDPKLSNDKLVKDKDNVYFNYEPVYEDTQGQAVTIQIVDGNRKPELLIDDNTREYLEDPNNMFNLTLSKFPQSDGLYLGQVQIAGKDGVKNTFNLRIDYYVMGYTPIIQIKAFDTIYYDIYDLKVFHKKTIKDIIRICNQSSMKMVVNQLQSMVSINSKLNGSYLKLNFNSRKDKNINLNQNYVNLVICNENLMRSMYKNNYRQFQGIVFFDNLGGRMLVTVTEFNLDVEQISKNVQENQVLHGNKHIMLDEKQSNLKRTKKFQQIKIWKINIFNIYNSRNHEAVISYEDLIGYYQSEIFKFYESHPNMIKPNLVQFLHDYIRNLFVYRTKVGYQLFWKLPQFTRPLDENGNVVAISSDQLYKLQRLEVYQKLQKRIDEQNKTEDSNALPFSLDQMKIKRNTKEPPTLSLRNKLIIEKELPIFSSEDTKTLKLTSSSQEIIVQMPKVFNFFKVIQYSIITVTLYPTMECWMWSIYFIKTQRTYTISFYPSDLFHMDPELLNHSSIADAINPAVGLWVELIRRADLMQNPSGDILLVVDNYKEPLREVLFQDHVYNDNAEDIFFMEVILKSQNNFVTEVYHSFYPLDMETDEVTEYTIGIRAYSLTRNVWIKDFQSLNEVVRILKKENYFSDTVKFLYYSMLKDASSLLANKIVFSDEAKSTEVRRRKLTYDIKQLINNKDQFQKLREESREELTHRENEGRNRQKQKSASKNPNKLDDTHDLITKDRGLRPEWKNQIELNKIIYQGVVSQNPVQVCTVIYNDVKDTFIYKLYRVSDCTTYEKRITAVEIMRTCAPNYQSMIKNGMQSALGQRICDYFKTNIIVASLMNYYNIQK